MRPRVWLPFSHADIAVLYRMTFACVQPLQDRSPPFQGPIANLMTVDVAFSLRGNTTSCNLLQSKLKLYSPKLDFKQIAAFDFASVYSYSLLFMGSLVQVCAD